MRASKIDAYFRPSLGNKDANLMAHAVLGAVVAQAQGNSALAGAAGASVGEYIANQLYPGKKTSELSEEQRQTISALSTLAGGLAGGLVGGDASNAVAGASVAKNAVENNFLRVPEAERKKVLERKLTSGTITAQEVGELASLNKVDKERDAEIKAVCTAGNLGGSACGQLITVAKSAAERYGESASYSLLYKDLYPQDSQNLAAILQGLDSDSITRDTAITAITQASGLSRQEVENRYNFAMTAQALTAVLAGAYLPRGTSVTSKETVAKDPVSLAGQADNEAGILVDRNVIVGSAKGGSPEPVTYFRVEGGGSGTKTSQNRITANEDGTITINPGCAGQICVSVGNAEHATYYLTNKRPDGSVVVFDVDAGLHKEIMDRVVPQRPVAGMTKDPDAPKRVDKDQPGYSLELPKVWESLLEKNSSNARVYTQDEFFKEFKQ
ncbi:VENN motif pre-toxin domain-containing protein [Pseudomonas syringae pv. aptata]|uniref:VENN motif pre-toxin domain-containing protein n=1 Tax=Pseudomonas syringae TaxID=317 RepID=UPI003F8B97A0